MSERDDRILTILNLFQKAESAVIGCGETNSSMMATLIFGSYVTAATTAITM